MRDPQATYRVQLHGGFGFDQAAELAPYLAALGISHVYSSPCLQAARGSTHSYDVVDHSRVNLDLGGPEGHRRFCDELGRAGLGQLLDVVPNHMAITPENQWWWDVLENGPSSPYAACFDVDWDPPESRLRNVVLLPVLSDHYGRVLVAVVPRLVLGLEGEWRDTTLELPPGRWRDALTGESAAGRVRLAELLARFPVALLLTDHGV